MKINNLTPHTINICDENGCVAFSLPPAGVTCRVGMKQETTDMIIMGAPVVRNIPEAIIGLPEEEDEAINIVSAICLPAVPAGRHDVFAPDTGAASVVRDKDGNIIGVKGFLAP